MSTPESFLYDYGLPAQQALCLDLLNSTWHEEDRLVIPGWLDHLWTRYGVQPPGVLDGHILTQFQAFREVAQTVVEHRPPAEETMVAFNAYLAAAPFVQRLTWSDDQFSLTEFPMKQDWGGMLGQIAQTFAQLLAADRGNIKQCANPECRWIYFDHSPNLRRRWCEDACANRMRVRQFRAKQREHRQPVSHEQQT